MQSRNRAIVAAAGGGKTTRIVKAAALAAVERAALITYTREGVDELRHKAYELSRSIPGNVEIWSWLTFLLHELARPYQKAVYERRIDGIAYVDGKSDRFAKEIDTARFYFRDGKNIYSDKLSRFICVCNDRSGGAVIRRIEQRFDHIYIDEIQDCAGYDLDVLELLLKSKVKVTLVGDHRQGTYQTNYSSRNKAYARNNIVKKLEEWGKAGLLQVKREQDTHRSNQLIASFADGFYPNEPKTKSLNEEVTGHDGVFWITLDDVPEYVKRFSPQVLRLSKVTDCLGLDAMNFGASKGKTFDRVLIFLHKKGTKWAQSGDFSLVQGSLAKMYVGATRARYSLTFVTSKIVALTGVTRYDLNSS